MLPLQAQHNSLGNTINLPKLTITWHCYNLSFSTSTSSVR